MDISKDARDRISAMVEYARRHDGVGGQHVEVEARFVGRSDSGAFQRCVAALRESGADESSAVETMDVSFVHEGEDVRISVVGATNIAAYCRRFKSADVPEDSISAIAKDSVAEMTPVVVHDQALKFKLKLERAIEVRDPPASTMKAFRLKRRVSFVPKTQEASVVRYDLTVVRSSARPAQTLQASGYMQSDNKYELEVELARDDGRTRAAMVETFLRSAALLAKNAHDGPMIPPLVLREYAKLVYGGKPPPCGPNTPPPFVGPKPVRLQTRHIVRPEDAAAGVLTIHKDYTVTDKADGERCLMFVASTGRAYFINDRIVVRDAGFDAPGWDGTLVDGEFIDKPMRGGRAIYAIFDAYYVHGTSIVDLHLSSEDAKRATRLKHVKAFVDSIADAIVSPAPYVRAKTFVTGPGVGKAAVEMWLRAMSGDDSFPYLVDGLIFTPADVAVGASSAGAKPKFGTGGTWDNVYKWKPVEHSTIDMLVRFRRNGAGGPPQTRVKPNGRTYIVADVYVGHRTATAPITPLAFLEASSKSGGIKESYGFHKFFVPGERSIDTCKCLLPTDDAGFATARSGERIEDETIVEFAIQQDDTDSPWVPTRVRVDKTDKLRRSGGSASGTANSYAVAVDVWHGVQDPITVERLSEPLAGAAVRAVDGNDAYYVSGVERDESTSRAMREFHNSWIKRHHIVSRLAEHGKCKSLLDLGCGRGGDVRKWQQAGFAVVVGVDKVADNIVNPNGGACARALQTYSSDALEREVAIAFLIADVGRPLDSARTYEDDESRKIADVLWARVPKENLAPPRLQRLYGLAKAGSFDAVTCMFAIHYFFETRDALHTFLANVSSALHVGGVFVGTCLDGMEVHRAFVDAGSSKVSGSTDDGRLAWSLTRAYEDKGGPPPEFGAAVDAYVESIGQTVREYLVGYDVLCREAAAVGLRPLTADECDELRLSSTSGLFSELFADMASVKSKSRSMKLAMEMTATEKTYSFMHRWFAFTKA
jgi:SAM-dependent methyltransferase